jgi:hypothetical protein
MKKFIVTMFGFLGEEVDIQINAPNRHFAEHKARQLIDSGRFRSMGAIGEIFEHG